MIRFPSSHLSVRVYNRLDVVLDVLLLSDLVVQGNRTEGERFENELDVSLGAAGYAYAEVQELGIDKVL